MASRYKLISMPPLWMSAHRKNEVKLKLPQTTISSGYDDGNGFLKLNLAGSFLFTIVAGDRVYIPAGTDYTGFHTVKEVVSSIEIILNTPYTSSISGSAVIWQVALPLISIYKGYEQGDMVLTYDDGTVDLSTIQPYTLAGEFYPEVGTDGYITFDICGYLKTVIEAPYKAAYNPDEQSFLYNVTFLSVALWTYTPKYYNRVKILLTNPNEQQWCLSTHYAANAAITTDDLNRNFVDTERQMQPLKVPVKLFDKFTVGDYINQNLLTAKYTY